MEIVDLIYLIQVQHILETLYYIDFFWGGFHQDGDTISENWHGGEYTQECKDESADWISYMPFWLQIDDNSCNNNTDTLYNISNNVNNSCSNIHIFMTMIMTMMTSTYTVMMMSMIMFMFFFVMFMFVFVFLMFMFTMFMSITLIMLMLVTVTMTVAVMIVIMIVLVFFLYIRIMVS